MKHLRLSSIILVGVWLALLSGCAKKEDESPAEPNTDTESPEEVRSERTESSSKEDTVRSSAEGTLFKDVLALWDAGQKDEAAKQFLTIQWSNPSVFRGIQALNMSEQELGLLPQDEVKRIAEEAHALTKELRNLMFYVASIGDERVSSGDIQIAKEHFEAVRLYGEALSQPERLEIMRLIGKAIMAHGQKKLSSIQ